LTGYEIVDFGDGRDETSALPAGLRFRDTDPVTVQRSTSLGDDAEVAAAPAEAAAGATSARKLPIGLTPKQK
jgi:hypothetical protein